MNDRRIVLVLLLCLVAGSNSQNSHPCDDSNRNLMNVVVYEGNSTSFTNQADPAGVKWKISPSFPVGTDPNTVAENGTTPFPNSYSVIPTQLNIHSASIFPQPPYNNYSTSGLYVVTYTTNPCQAMANLIVVYQGPTCRCNKTDPDKAVLICQIDYGVNHLRPNRPVMNWTTENGDEAFNEASAPTQDNPYVDVSTLTCDVTSSGAALYTCGVTFDALDTTGMESMASNKPPFYASCSIANCVKKTAIASNGPETTTNTASCPKDLMNIVVNEGDVAEFENLDDGKPVKWHFSSSSDPKNNLLDITDYDNTVNPMFKGAFNVTKTKLTILNATSAPKGNNSYATAGVYFLTYYSTGCQTAANLIVIQSVPVCARNENDPNSVILSCNISYAESERQPSYPTMTWTTGSVVIPSDQPTTQKHGFVNESLSQIRVNDTAPSSYKCQVTFKPPAPAPIPFLAQNAPSYNQSCITASGTFPPTTEISTTTAGTFPPTANTEITATTVTGGGAKSDVGTGTPDTLVTPLTTSTEIATTTDPTTSTGPTTPAAQPAKAAVDSITTPTRAGVLGLYRLVGSTITEEGRLEVFYRGAWGTVCGDSFSNVEAKVACGSLGYSHGGVFIYNQYGPGQDQPIWLASVKCNGSEQSIADCTHRPWGENSCFPNQDVSIRCNTTTSTGSTTPGAQPASAAVDSITTLTTGTFPPTTNTEIATTTAGTLPPTREIATTTAATFPPTATAEIATTTAATIPQNAITEIATTTAATVSPTAIREIASTTGCPKDLQNIVVNEGDVAEFENLDNGKPVKWHFSSSSDPKNNLLDITNYDNTVNPMFVGAYEVTKTKLTILNATAAPKGNNPYATAGVYFLTYQSTGCQTAANLIVIQSGPVCDRNENDPNSVILSCNISYAESQRQPAYPTMNWTTGSDVIPSDQPTTQEHGMVNESLSQIRVNDTTPSYYQCQVTFKPPARDPISFLAQNAPSYTESCTIKHYSAMTTAATPLTTGVPFNCSGQNLTNTVVYENTTTSFPRLANGQAVQWEVLSASDFLDEFKVIAYPNGSVTSQFASTYTVTPSELGIAKATCPAQQPSMPYATAGLYRLNYLNPNCTYGAHLIVIRSGPDCSCDASNTSNVQLICSVNFAAAGIQPSYPVFTWKDGTNTIQGPEQANPWQTSNSMRRSTSTFVVAANDATTYTCQLTFGAAPQTPNNFVTSTAPTFKASCHVYSCASSK